MVRALLAAVAVVPVLAACSGAQALQAQDLLQQANAAQQNLSSMTFTANLRVEANGQSFGMKLTGGGYAKGPHAGDVFVDLDMSQIPSLPFAGGHMVFAKRGSRMSMRIGNQTMALPATSSASTRANPLAAFDIARYVKDVKVRGGQMLNGKPVTKIVGVLDTAALLEQAAALQGYAGQSLPDLDGKLSDTRVVGFVDDTTHLLVAALADVSVRSDGFAAKLHMDYGLTSVNKPVAIPTV